MSEIRVVVDTSIIIAAYLSRNPKSTPNLILEKWRRGCFQLVVTPQILEEYVVVLQRKKIEEEQIFDLIDELDEKGLQFEGIYETEYLDSIDPYDNFILAAALESKSNYIVSLDKKHILPMKHFHRTQIVLPHLFLSQISQGTKKKNSKEVLLRQVEAAEIRISFS